MDLSSFRIVNKTGVATTDALGAYSLKITPDMTPVTGKYTVVANFAGSNSYWGSSAESAFTVYAAASTPTSSQSTIESYFIPAVVAIILVVIIIGILIMLMLRKRA